MNDLLDLDACRAILDRIQALTPDSRAEWGKMDVAQMLAHCQAPLQIAVGERTMKRGLIGRLFGGFARRSLARPEPFGKNMPTAPSFKIADARDFDEERDRLVALVRRFTDGGSGALSSEHPFFGPMTPEEWGSLQWKHLDHHLRQFGA